MIMWSAVILRILENGSTRSPGHGSTTGSSIAPTGVAAAAGGGGGGGGGGGAGFGGSGLDAGGAEAAAGGDATAPFSVSITATSVCTGTVWPSCTLISASTPAAGAGISASTLSVEISNNGSSRFTGSPSFLSHLLKVPSAMDSPIWGIKTSTRAMQAPWQSSSVVRHPSSVLICGQRTTDGGRRSVRRQPSRGFHDVFRLRQHKVLERRCVRQRHVVGGHPHDRSVEPFERLLVDAGRDFPGDAPGPGVLVDDQHLVGLLHRAHDRGVVQGQQR